MRRTVLHGFKRRYFFLLLCLLGAASLPSLVNAQIPQMRVLGTNGAMVASGEVASQAKGTDFSKIVAGGSATHTLTITNSGDATLNIASWTTNGTDAGLFTISGIAASVATGAVENFTVQFDPTLPDSFAASVSIVNDSTNTPYTLNLAGSAYELSVDNGPYAGGNSITITNGMLGDGSDITNVTVGGVAATITGQGTSWVTITMPAVGSAGVKDILIQSTSVGNSTFANAYTYNPAGRINDSTYALPSLVTLTNSWLDGTNGIILAGAAEWDNSGYSVSSAGDVNGDGLADLLVGAYNAGPSGRNGAGETYLIYGQTNGLPPLITLTNSWFDGSNGIILAGAVEWDASGLSVSSAGDVNGDGLADLLVGACYATPSGRVEAGETYLIYSQSNGLPPLITLTNSWLDGTNGIILAGAVQWDNSGISVSSAGDVNGDGLADLLVGAFSAAPSGRSDAGETYLIYGQSNGLPSLITLTNSWLDGTNGVILAGAVRGDNSGVSISSAGDVNGDGLVDLLVGAYLADPSGRSCAGETYLIYGQSNGLPPLITLTNSWLDGTNGIILAGAGQWDQSGMSVSSAGDVNGDGFADLLVGAYSAGPSGRDMAGETYLIYGQSNGLPPLITLTNSWPDGTNGVILAGAVRGDNSGVSVSSAGDVNGDGLADLLVGAYAADPSGRDGAGETYLIYGQTNGLPSLITLTNSWLDGTNGIILAGAAAEDYSGYSVSSAGDVNGDGFADLLVGAYDADPSGRDGAGETYLIYGRTSSSGVEPDSGPVAGGTVVTINGSNLGNGMDITNVTLCGVPATSIDSQSATQVVVTTAVGVVGLGDVVIYSTSYGVTTKDDIFEYLKADQTITFPAIGDQETTNRMGLAASADSGLGVSFAVGSGLASIAGGTNLSFIGAGAVSIVASQAGDINWNAAADVTNTFSVTKATAGVTLNSLSQNYDGTPRVVTATTVPPAVTVDITYNGSSTAPTAIGSYTVTGLVNDVMYQGGQTGTLVVAKGIQVISDFIPTNRSEFMVSDMAGLSATSSIGTPVTFVVSSGPALITEGTNLAFTSYGTVSIAATAPGNANWATGTAVNNYSVRDVSEEGEWTAWTQINVDGFGDANNFSAFSMEAYSNSLYVGTWNNPRGCEIWRWNGPGPSDWVVIRTGGFGSSNNRGAHSMAVYNGRLYVGTANNATGFEVWAYDGAGWTQVASGGLGNTANTWASSMVVHDGKLYVGTSGKANIYAYDGNVWTQVNVTAFGDADNTQVRSLESYNDELYAGVYNNTDYANLYRFDGPSTSDWTQVAAGGFGNNFIEFRSLAAYNGRLFIGGAGFSVSCQVWEYIGGTFARNDPGNAMQRDSARCMEVFHDRLFVGTGNDSGVPSGGQVWMYNGISGVWTQMNVNGFGDTANEAVHSMKGFGNCLFAGVSNSDGDGGKVFMKCLLYDADLAVAESVDNASPDYGDDITFTVTLTNRGPDDATGIIVTDAVPVELVSPGVSVSAGSWADNQWSIGTLSSGAAATLTLTGSVACLGMTNAASVAALDQTDTNAANDAASSSVIPFDNVPPTISCPGDINELVDAGCELTLPDYTGMATVGDNCDGFPVVNQLPVPGTTISGAGTVQAVKLWGTDASGNSNSCTFNVTLVDAIAPSISGCPSDITTTNDPGDCSALVSWTAPTADDNCGVDSFVSTFDPGDSFNVGTTTVEYVATDTTGNSITCTFSVVVADVEDPTITCPADIVVNADYGTNTAVVTFSDPTYDDNCPGAVLAQTGGMTSGSAFPTGTTLNAFMVTDVAGNTAGCSFNVTVRDRYPLTLVATNGYILGATNGFYSPTFIFDLMGVGNNGYVFDSWTLDGADAGSAPILTVTSDRPHVVTGNFAAAAWDMNATGTASMVSYRQIPGLMPWRVTMQVCNPAGSGEIFRDKYIYAQMATASLRLQNYDGLSPYGEHYVDITAEVLSKLPLTGNGDLFMDSGECVVLDEIEMLGKAVPIVQGKLYSKKTPDMRALDTDHDGVPNGWEDDQDLDRNDPADAGMDQDSDGVPAGDEYSADTNPRDPSSYLRVHRIEPFLNGHGVIWIGGTSVLQYLEWTALLPGGWQTLATNLPPTEMTNVFNGASGDQGFYRIRAVRE